MNLKFSTLIATLIMSISSQSYALVPKKCPSTGEIGRGTTIESIMTDDNKRWTLAGQLTPYDTDVIWRVIIDRVSANDQEAARKIGKDVLDTLLYVGGPAEGPTSRLWTCLYSSKVGYNVFVMGVDRN